MDNEGRTIWYLVGGRLEKNWKKIVCRHKSQKKKFLKNVGRKKSFIDFFEIEIDEKCVDQEKPPNANVHNRESIRQKMSSTKHKKNCRTLIAKKKIVLSRRWKKKFASNKNFSPPPPDIQWYVP